jgi:hypothetical protein
MLRIQRVANGEVVFTVSGQMHEENIAELRDLFRLEAQGLLIVLNLKDLTLVDREAVRFWGIATPMASSSGIARHISASGYQEKETRVTRVRATHRAKLSCR